MWVVVVSGFVQVTQGKHEKSGKIRKRFPVTRKSGNVDYSPDIGEKSGNLNILGQKIKPAHDQVFFEAENNQVMVIG